MFSNFNELKRLFDEQTNAEGKAIVLTFINLLEGKSIYAAKRIFKDAYRKVETVNRISRTKNLHPQQMDPNEQ